jgi:hypothetical protein
MEIRGSGGCRDGASKQLASQLVLGAAKLGCPGNQSVRSGAIEVRRLDSFRKIKIAAPSKVVSVNGAE